MSTYMTCFCHRPDRNCAECLKSRESYSLMSTTYTYQLKKGISTNEEQFDFITSSWVPVYQVSSYARKLHLMDFDALLASSEIVSILEALLPYAGITTVKGLLHALSVGVLTFGSLNEWKQFLSLAKVAVYA